jgi:hypothetical protein
MKLTLASLFILLTITLPISAFNHWRLYDLYCNDGLGDEFTFMNAGQTACTGCNLVGNNGFPVDANTRMRECRFLYPSYQP